MPAPMTAETFWSKVDIRGEDECWPWLGSFGSKGYGQVGWGGKKLRAHRVAYTLTIGPIPDGLILDHIECKNRACCNPKHLRPVTIPVNTMENSDSIPALNAQKTHCKRGHPLFGENLILERNGTSRRCRICARERNEQWKAKIAA